MAERNIVMYPPLEVSLARGKIKLPNGHIAKKASCHVSALDFSDVA